MRTDYILQLNARWHGFAVQGLNNSIGLCSVGSDSKCSDIDIADALLVLDLRNKLVPMLLGVGQHQRMLNGGWWHTHVRCEQRSYGAADSFISFS